MFSELKRFHPAKIALLAGVVVLGGSAVAAGAAPAHQRPTPPAPVSVVTAVNGVSTAGTCGTSGATGDFTTVGSRLDIVTVDVTAATTFTDTTVASASFADVCVGTHVAVATSSATDGSVTAVSVTVLPPAIVSEDGVVTSVNGVPTAGTCGVAGKTGTYTYVGARLHIVTVDVTASTTFTDVADPTPSFADVCVANHVRTDGTFSSGALIATSVSVKAPNTGHVQGIVTSVNGVAAANTCGTAGTSGTFNLVGNWRRGIVTVDVSPTTTFVDAAVSSPSFAQVCVGSPVTATGLLSSATLTASTVSVLSAVAQPEKNNKPHGGHGHGRR
jgi:hypothetical protein